MNLPHSKNDPDYLFEEYKGYIIASHKDKVPEKDMRNLISVYRSGDFPDYGYIVGMDDSKTYGNRKKLPCNLEDAKSYIDWAVKCCEEKTATKPENPEQQKRRGPKM